MADARMCAWCVVRGAWCVVCVREREREPGAVSRTAGSQWEGADEVARGPPCHSRRCACKPCKYGTRMEGGGREHTRLKKERERE
jgi:hypothetical protein